MSKVKFRFTTDIESALREAIESMMFDGLGADGTSSYEVADVSLDVDGEQSYSVTVDLERVEGKFVSNEELEEVIASNLGEITVNIDYV